MVFKRSKFGVVIINFFYRILKRVLYMNLETIRTRGRPRNRWQDEVREDGRIVGGEEWQEKLYDRKEWKKGKESSHYAQNNGIE
jgi:hypothetical protein